MQIRVTIEDPWSQKTLNVICLRREGKEDADWRVYKTA